MQVAPVNQTETGPFPPPDLGVERRLVERAQRDPDAFAELYDRYVAGVYRFAFRRTGTRQDAEDITAQTFYRALEKLPAYEWRGLPFGAWLYRIAANLIADHHRAGGVPVSLDGLTSSGFHPPDPQGGDLAASLMQIEQGKAVWAAVALLPPLQRRAVTLRFASELSHAEVGSMIGRSEAATKQLIYRAMLTLRQKMGVK